VTKNGNTGTLYVNGAQVGQNSSMPLDPSSLGNTTQNWIGRSQYSGDAFLDGQVDDFRIYNRPLSAAEVQTLATGGGGGTPTVTPTRTSTPTVTPTGTQATGGLWAHYAFEGNASDSSGNGRNGTLVNSPTFVAGQVGQAVNLAGGAGGSASQHISLPTGIVNGLTNFTVATWVRLDTSGAWRRIFDFGTGTTANMFLVPQSGTGTFRFAITTGGAGAEQQINASPALPTAVWTHVAVTKSGNTATLFVNGVQVAQNTGVTLSPSSLGNTNQNWIGRSQYAGDAFLDGQVDEFRIYNRALSAAEIQALFQNP
jgi:hypothetical protein